jgi:DUF4097 and DUF4098 domain-containing protein YvlB
MSAPTPIPERRPYRPRSVFGPLILIIIGVLILLHNMGVISMRSFGWWFAHYWPVLLIVWGAVKLLEYMWARQKGYANPRLGGGSIVFLVFFVLFGIGATNSLNWDWPAIHGQFGDDSDFDFEDMWGSHYDFTDNFSQPMASPQQIRIIGRRGDITVKASQDGQAHAVVEKSLRSDSQSAADRLNQSTHAKFEQQGNIWVLDVTNGNFDHGRFNLNLELPPGGDLSISTRNGNISVEQRPGNVNLSTGRGDITVEQVKGDAMVNLKRGTLTTKNVSGNVTIDGGGDINIEDIGGAVTMTAGYPGTLQMARIAKQVRFSTSRTDLQFARLDGDLTMDLDSLHATAVGGPLKLDTRNKSVHLEDLAGDVHIDDKNATIDLQTKAPLGDVDISSARGEIQLSLPAKAAFQLDAQSVGGEIQSQDFNLKVDNSGHIATASGTVGKGGPPIRLRADHGTIHIKKTE